MRTLYLIYFFLLQISKIIPTLLVIEAEPESITGCVTYALSKEGCLIQLLNSSDLFAYGTDGNCTMCSWLEMFYETHITGTFFAIKTNMTTCPSSPYSAISGENYTTVYANYSWTLVKTCPSGYFQSDESNETFCMKIFLNEDAIDIATALSYCETISSVVIGFETDSERRYATAQLLTLSPNSSNVTMWVGGHRITGCQYSSEETYANCTWTVGWAFADTHLQTYGGYDFQSGEPSWGDTTNGVPCCLQLVASSNDSDVNGTIFSASCDATTNGYGCGFLLT